MKTGDLVRIREGSGFKNAGQLAIVIRQDCERWWDIMYTDGRKGAVMQDVVEVVNEGG